MKLTWLGHSCFKVEEQGAAVILDPYAPGSVPGLKEVHASADLVLCTHDHFDHNYEAAVTLTDDSKEAVFTVTSLDVAHDDKGGKLRGRTKIYLLEANGYKIAHFGDIGCELTLEEKAQLKYLDAILVPVGGYYTIDGKQAADLVMELKPGLAIPMHYRSDKFGFSELGQVTDFTNAFPQEDVVFSGDSSVELRKDELGKTTVLVLQAENAE